MENLWNIHGKYTEHKGNKLEHTHGHGKHWKLCVVQCIYLEGQQPAALRFSSELQMRLSKNATQNEVLTGIGIQL
jgi:hypothetical protein